MEGFEEGTLLNPVAVLKAFLARTCVRTQWVHNILTDKLIYFPLLVL